MAIAPEMTPRVARSKPAAALTAIAILLTALVAPRADSAAEVDLALVLGIDCSYSVDQSEFLLQVRGTADAFVSPQVLAAIAEGENGRIAVTVVHWSSSSSQEVIAPWTVVSGRADAERLAQVIAGTPRRSNDRATSISSFIDFGVTRIRQSGHTALRQAIDVASDGLNNDGGSVEQARDRALAAGITVNGLAILDGTWWLPDYFREHVTGGPGSFVLEATTYDSFAEAIRRKLEREIRGASVS